MGTDPGLGVVICKQHIIVYLLSFVLSRHGSEAILFWSSEGSLGFTYILH